MEPNVNQNQNLGYPAPGYQQQAAPVISVKDWMLTILLLIIPVVNLIMLFVWAFGGGANPSKANYAKASLLWALIGIAIYIVFFVLIFGAFFASVNGMK
ncbi:hypothetical protein GCM10023310_25330 [Paenibacillus vulneris]|uniref:Interferon-induced transmembrane protein n=1 Tax=Paenibacillus vulneris TaxID=1133364 RepID=A0ABW3USM0_9BACL|nr:hypothetical protein [Paenibacillus sp. 32352]